MADFRNLQEKIHNLKDAQNLLEVFRITYADAKVVQGLLARYQSDADYKAAVDYLFTAAQRAEIAAMIGQVNALLQDWESNHPSVLAQEG